MKKNIENRFIKMFLKNKLAKVGMILVLIIFVLSIFIPIISPYELDELDLRIRFQKPSINHFFGTDELGRDLFVRVFYAGRISILVGMVGTIISTALGIFLGAISGYYGGKIDVFLLKIHEIQLCFPPIIIIMALMSMFSGSLKMLIVFLGFFMWPNIYRVTRGQFLSLKNEEYVESAKLSGSSNFKIMFKHILPNALAPIIVSSTLLVAELILMEAALSFLGVGVQPPIPSWGNILYTSKNLTILRDYYWMWLPTGIILFLFVLGINFFGDGLRDAMNPYED